MTSRRIRSFWHDERAAISSLYAVGILALVGIAGVGFDYGRLMALNSELQNAADQAALAAATQLDGRDGAMQRARDAATNALASATSNYVNETRFANDGSGRPITGLTFQFYDGYSGDTPGNLLTSDTDAPKAQVVQVTVNARKVFYALTPVVGAFNSGDVIGRALAGLQSATCDVPPMMFCVPQQNGVANRDFPTASDIGKGLKLHMNSTSADPWTPGNFGFLNITYNTQGNPNRRLGLNSAAAGCFGDLVQSDTGARDTESDALNTRFDMYPTGNNLKCDPTTGNFCPAQNVRRDYVSVETTKNVKASDIAGLACNSAKAGNWTPISSLPATATALPPLQGFAMDDCFASGTCTVLGDGQWSGSKYMSLQHPGTSLATAAPDGTRFEVYEWELGNPATLLTSPKKVGYNATLVSGNGNGNNSRYNVDLYCSYPQPVVGTGVPASNTQKDRRVLTVAAVDCTGLNGKSTVDILRWVDLFLVQPANLNGSDKAFFTEVMGPAKRPNGESGFQFYGRKKAVLIR